MHIKLNKGQKLQQSAFIQLESFDYDNIQCQCVHIYFLALYIMSIFNGWMDIFMKEGRLPFEKLLQADVIALQTFASTYFHS